tara:strand:- start:435 stop:629 length:195 start_codon:yes stop_codon:yes gene_type:complete
MKTIEYTDNELQLLVQLLDIAVKAQGLPVAEAALLLAKKVEAATQTSNEMDIEESEILKKTFDK